VTYCQILQLALRIETEPLFSKPRNYSTCFSLGFFCASFDSWRKPVENMRGGEFERILRFGLSWVSTTARMCLSSRNRYSCVSTDSCCDVVGRSGLEFLSGMIL